MTTPSTLAEDKRMPPSTTKRTLFKGAMGLAAAGAMLRAGAVRAATPALWDQISSTGTMRVGVISNRQPYIYDADGGYKGFSIVMAQDLAKALEVAMGKPIKIEWLPTTWPSSVLDLQANKIDIFFGFAFSPERAQALDLVGPLYYTPEVAVLGRNQNFGDQWSDLNKPGITVSAAMGTTDEQAGRRYLPNATMRAMKSYGDAVLDVQSGNSVALITSAIIGFGAMSANPNLTNVRVLKPVVSGPSGAGVRKDGDGRFFTFCQGFSWVYRQSGQSKKVILAAMEELGMNLSKVPSDIEF
jgi:polar amino acid transport system substrate-binding protein